ncbi:MAG: YceH family protein, partial [Shewanella sp.]
LEVEAYIKQLMERDKPVLAQLPREPGKRECRYTELFSQGAEQINAASSTNTDAHPLNEQDRQQLEARVTQLEEQVAELKDKLDSLIASLS